ncbi:class I SAM-dependent methyltransferase [Streptomyces zagrosensis]|uniref:SAM-dependent methyltransferase n=1 Tax=Streptomyces zagrosensis TaxID=1042984 RepID=A0A7W9V386_9ACTN|nr:class I SAM-dependent methyltransferase [Streptomyces zagrosensis]MBB5939644.1 SAM-dependent methyltransferase [Streptomyces zagrosensis]
MPVTTAYAFDNQAAQAPSRLGALEAAYDPITIARIGEIDLPPGARCWEVGAGGGSIAHHLATLVRPTGGRVLATDLELALTSPAEGLELRQHDLRGSLPSEDRYDLVHARLVLGHIPERHEILAKLVDAVAPGGWLLIEEFDATSLQRPLTTPTFRDAEIIDRVVDLTQQLLIASGADPAWGTEAHAAMAAVGLTDVHTREHAESWSGGSAGARLMALNTVQLRPRLLAAGATEAELDRVGALLTDPAVAVTSWRLVSTRGRRAA